MYQKATCLWYKQQQYRHGSRHLDENKFRREQNVGIGVVDCQNPKAKRSKANPHIHIHK